MEDQLKFEFGFGNGTQEVYIPQNNLLGAILPNPISIPKDADVVRNALKSPIGTARLREIVRPGEKIAIITSDITRPMPTALVMPAILEELKAAAVNLADVTLVFGLGSHRKQTRSEMEKLAGPDILKQIRAVDSDPEDCIRMGVTSRGTPVDITRTVASADRRICLGNIEYHYFAGYSGGAKAIMPGVSTREAIQCNHRHMVNPLACAGEIGSNPVRADIEEAGKICGIDFILNVVLDEHKKIVQAVAGDPIEAHRVGAKFLDQLYMKEISQQADIVIVSQGGAPKDINLYQTQKALDNAKYAVKKGGTIILIGSCKEGLGEKVFEEWMTEAACPQEMVERIGRDFQLGGHKAAAIGMVLENADILLVSELEPDLVQNIFLKPYSNAQQAFRDSLAKHGPNAKVWVIPYGGSVLPRFIG